ncbi:hypothetical protein UA08_08805 [Talaromyces atroroseus]|uniref:Nephrocystin 3-like N-terminal domain-containing protein n=1 Tax=Talaromyces atroroseus TaxID=1441469 RepID=A0A225AD95_TALAT|nr:hypothetical protein UA08_08805 [Talaromyces atroroseus]OKL55904.1 hypothetical protein UA08_08805 [Talaromyces atroroseus]
MTRIRQSKGTLLAQCYTWIIQSPELQRWQTESDTRLLWMKGGPGKGKTMAMIGCKKDHGKDILDGPNAFAILTTMLCRVLEDETMGTVFLLVDALDECDNGMYSLLDWIVNEASRPSTKGKWLLSSRHSPAFEDYFLSSHCMACRSLDYGEGCMSDAVNYSIKYRVKQLAERKNISLVLQNEVETELKAKAESTFLWVALVCQRLQWISRRRLKKELKETPPGLELLYDRMLQQFENYDDEEDRGMCLRIISTVIVACCPLNFKELAIAAELPANIIEDIHQLVELCGSFFTVSNRGYLLMESHLSTVRFLSGY